MARGTTRPRKQADADRPGVADPTAPLHSGELLTAARPVLSLLRTDLEARATDPGVTRALEARYEDEKKHKLTGDSFAAWREARIAQIAASWFLSCVFVRTLEDRGLLGQARLAGPGAMDSQEVFVQLAPSLTERDYLLFVFRELAELPASRALFDREHALVWQLSPSAEAAKELLRLFRTPIAEAPAFRFGQASTRFLGDLYQDLYEDVRKRFALLQTPDFVEGFILDRTLEPAITRFGLDDTTLIDPTCGSGHFLLGAFDRLFEHRLRQTPGLDVKLAAQRALDAVFGADINPYAVAIARMRLVLTFLEKAGIQKLKDAPAPKLHLVVADSLRYNPQHVQLAMEHHAMQDAKDWVGDAFAFEDDEAARDVLLHRYAVVVGNPPYITEKDPAKRETYRAMYPRSAAGKYALSAPFCERFFQLARDRGYVGQITANSFMKREFGKALIEEFLPTVNLELIINTSGAYIPGHGTPTVLLFGTHEPPVAREVGTVLAKRGEPSTPEDPAKGEVWSSIAEHWNEIDFENAYISVASTERDKLAKHPWSLGGGGAVELKELLEERAEKRLSDLVDDIGFASFTGLDDAFVLPSSAAKTLGLESEVVRPMVIGEDVRDWSGEAGQVALVPYSLTTHSPLPYEASSRWGRFLWRYRTVSNNVTSFGGKTRQQCGENWWEWYRWQQERYAAPFRITFAEVATHNHFVLDKGGKVFKQTAPIIKLAEAASEEVHLALLAYLNSSTACFWLKQVCFPKASAVKELHVGGMRPEDNRYAFSATAMGGLPIPPWTDEQRTLLAHLARQCLEFARRREESSAGALVSTVASGATAGPRDQATIDDERRQIEARLVTLQEDIDWLIYHLFGLSSRFIRSSSVYGASERPFETPSGTNSEWATRRDELAQSDSLRILETAVYKRLWSGRRGVFGHSVQTFEQSLRTAARDLIQQRAEKVVSGSQEITSRRSISHTLAVQADDVRRVAALLGGDPIVAIEAAVDAGETVPYLAVLRFSEQGIAKFREWEAVWAEQRIEDNGGPAPKSVPPRYTDKDFSDALYWRLRGKLDVPKERFISYPGCESDQDGEPVYGWAGWNHLQRAQALAALYLKRKTEEGWTAERLAPMLAGLHELLPWIQQWHNDLDPEYGLRMGDYFAQFLDSELATLGLTRAQLEAWRPQKASAPRAKSTSIAVASAPAPAPRRTRKPHASVDTTEAAGVEPRQTHHKQWQAGDGDVQGDIDDPSSFQRDPDARRGQQGGGVSATRSPDYLAGIVRELCKLANETEWVELKRNNDNPRKIGEYLSALSNAAALADKAFAYLVWGVDDSTHAIVGTTVTPMSDKIGNEELESWLLRLLSPKLNFRFHEVIVEGHRVVLLEIERARRQPTQFEGIDYCRVGNYKKKLKDFPEKERELWRVFDRTPFEDVVAREHASTYDVLDLLDYPSYFSLLGRSLPSNTAHILTALEEDRLVRKNDAGTWNVANLGAILFAKRLADFGPLGRKTVRVVVYVGPDRLVTLKEHELPTGYAAGFEGLITLINGLIPANEVIGKALRKTVPMYPELAVRELVANALIHQDFFVTGAGPMIEIFSDRMEVTNPGKPLVAIERFVDNPPRSRNEALASLMRRMGTCEERGSGVDKVVSETEQAQLPAPLFEVPDDSTRAVLFAHRPLTKMDSADRVRACYLHACLRYVNREYLTNASLRERFGLDEKNSATASRFIKEAVEDGAIVPADEGAARKLMKYMPQWAQAPKSKKG